MGGLPWINGTLKGGGAPMPFETVYPVSARISPAAEAEVDVLARELGMQLPAAYREFVTTFGSGTSCDYLVVCTPKEIRNQLGPTGQTDRERLALLALSFRQQKIERALTPEDLQTAVVFAHAAAEQPIWIACPQVRRSAWPPWRR